MGICYETAKGTAKDLKQAFECYRKGSEKNDSIGKATLIFAK